MRSLRERRQLHRQVQWLAVAGVGHEAVAQPSDAQSAQSTQSAHSEEYRLTSSD
jgi:hypothetical protein